MVRELEERIGELERRNWALEKELRTPVLGQLAWSISDAAKRIGIGRTKMYELIQAGEIVAVSVGGRRVVPELALRRFLGDPLTGVN